MTDTSSISSPAELLSPRPSRVLVFGATGSIGRATVKALVCKGHDVICFVRPRPISQMPRTDDETKHFSGVQVRFGDVTDRVSLQEDGFRGETFDAVVSCMASRTGTAKDAWAIDYEAHKQALAFAKQAGVKHFVLLSAICVQKPRLPFQHAKLAFENELMASGLTWSIVRPTAYFKSLSGQVERVRKGKPFLIFGDGRLTSCKPISDGDLGLYLAECLDDESRWNRILPIGGPGAAITPKEQGEQLFALLGIQPKFRNVPLALLKTIRASLAALGRFSPKLADKAELAAIGLYYASESMLVLNPATGLYDADATPSTGTENLSDHYAKLLRGEVKDDRGDHAVF